MLQDDRLLELLVDKFHGELPPAQEAELDGLLQQNPEVSPEDLEIAAGELLAAFEPADEPLPEHLLKTLSSMSDDFVPAAAPRMRVVKGGADSRPSPSWVPWTLAVAACAMVTALWCEGCR